MVNATRAKSYYCTRTHDYEYELIPRIIDSNDAQRYVSGELNRHVAVVAVERI